MQGKVLPFWFWRRRKSSSVFYLGYDKINKKGVFALWKRRSSVKDVLVVYKSRYGAAERYAKWIAEALGCEALPLKQVTTAGLLKYRMLISAAGFIWQNQRRCGTDQAVPGVEGQDAFCLYGGADRTGRRRILHLLYTRNFTEKMRKQIHFFAFPAPWTAKSWDASTDG